jgi:UDPglucose--hexose-1-phosphate uridylyltransferase
MYSSTNPPSLESNTRSAPEFRQDPVTGQWVVIAVDRAQRPQASIDAVADSNGDPNCPFCRGQEHETPPAVAVYPGDCPQGLPHDWQLRVVPNLYPALSRHGDPITAGETRESPILAHGWHEVVIESPDHLQRLTELPPDQVALVLQAYQDRFRVYAEDPMMRCAIAFKNCGRDAGMSLEHIHSQLVAFPFIPSVLAAELAGAEAFQARSGGCVYCHLAENEIRQQVRLVQQTDHFLAICPYASRVPFEIWVLPRDHQARFERLAANLRHELAHLLWDVLRRLEESLAHPAYNYVVHTCPFDTRSEDHYHWHFEIIPRIAHLAGLEWGTGVYVNIVSPEAAAHALRSA